MTRSSLLFTHRHAHTKSEFVCNFLAGDEVDDVLRHGVGRIHLAREGRLDQTEARLHAQHSVRGLEQVSRVRRIPEPGVSATGKRANFKKLVLCCVALIFGYLLKSSRSADPPIAPESARTSMLSFSLQLYSALE